MFAKSRFSRSILLLLLAVCLLSACGPAKNSPSAPSTPIPPTLVEPTLSLPSPTPTSVPSFASVNGENIPLSLFQNEVLRYRDALPADQPAPSEEEVNKIVLDSLVDQLLLAQEAARHGDQLSDEDLDARIQDLRSKIGSAEAYQDWLQKNHYDEAEFRQSMRLSTMAARGRDLIIASVPEVMEQVRVRQILLSNESDARYVLGLLQTGSDFSELAWKYNRQTGGELGWFPRNYLLYPALEEVAFSLAVNELSAPIQTELGWHVLRLMEHDPQHPLTTEMRIILQNRALEDWLIQARQQAVIQTVTP